MIDFYIENIELRRLIVSKKQLTFTIQYLFLNDFSNTNQSTRLYVEKFVNRSIEGDAKDLRSRSILDKIL